jgi:ATP/maltotriose-dependent transcriptional regulator MalT/DNA-binding SARP family transcriptional activator
MLFGPQGKGPRLRELKPQAVAFAKTTRPVIAAHVPRERLFARLDGSVGRTCAWISGPPGAGKTTLAASYVEARNYRALWYHVDADDADVATFFHYFRHAAQKVEGVRVSELPRFSPQYAADPASFARRFFRQLFAHAKAPLALVIDNLHEVPSDSGLYSALEAAMAQVPKKCLLLVTSRQEAPASFARLRVTGEMVSVGRDNLRLEPDELVQVAKLRGHELAADAVAELHQRTQGWAAGIVLMLEHNRLSGRIAEFPGDAAPGVIFDYLAGEIFERFEPKIRQFLLKVACLPRMTASVAESLSGEPKAARVLINLAQNDYFVKEVPSETGRVYQFHPLLRDFLRSRAAHDMPEALAPSQLQRAALLLRNAGHMEDAVSLLIEGGDWARVAAIAAEEAPAMLEQGRSETLAGWLDLLPPQLLAANAGLQYALAQCRSGASPRAARRLFEQAFDAYRRADDAHGMLETCRGVIDSIILEFDDLTGLDAWIGVLASMLKATPQMADSSVIDTLIRALLLRNPAHPELEAYLSIEPRGQPSLPRAAAAMVRGDFAAAEALLDELRPRAATASPEDLAAVGVALALSAVLGGKHAHAVAIAAETLTGTQAAGFHSYAAWLHAITATAALGGGDLDRARRELSALEASGAPLRRGDRTLLHYLRAWLCALDADVPGSQREAKAAVSLAVETGMPWLECLARIAVAQVIGEGVDRRGSEAQLRAAESLAERMCSPVLLFAVRLAAAEAAVQRTDPAAAAHVAAAFSFGREHGLQHVPGWRPGGIAKLCAFALRHSVEREYAAALVRTHKLVPAGSALLVDGWPWPFRLRTLGKFQLLRGNAPVEASGKGPGRPIELLKVLVALGGENVRTDQIADALWPHVDADYAHNSFTATLHRLRRLLGDEEAVLLRDSRLSLNPALAWVDTWAFEQVLDRVDESLRLPPAEGADGPLRSLTDQMLGLYRGPFLADESEQPAYIACREHLRARLLRCLTRTARRWEESGRGEVAIDCYLRCIEADPLFEAAYRNLMLCHQRMGEAAEARATYERLRTMLAARLKSAPSAETQAVLASLEPSRAAAPRT